MAVTGAWISGHGFDQKTLTLDKQFRSSWTADHPCCSSLRIARDRASRIKNPIPTRTGREVDVVAAPARIVPMINISTILLNISSLPF
jgi:hypothetical protein